MENVIITSFSAYNKRRYGTPWVCEIRKGGKYDFDKRVGLYTGRGAEGEAGDLVVFEPIEGQVYAYGQKDYRGSNTCKEFVKWNGEKFIECDILGRDKI